MDAHGEQGTQCTTEYAWQPSCSWHQNRYWVSKSSCANATSLPRDPLWDRFATLRVARWRCRCPGPPAVRLPARAPIMIQSDTAWCPRRLSHSLPAAWDWQLLSQFSRILSVIVTDTVPPWMGRSGFLGRNVTHATSSLLATFTSNSNLKSED